ncbi:MAG: nuclear transport factor 2 family protein [Solirubrobacteraceae bacterium]
MSATRELVQRWLDAVSRGDRETLRQMATPDMEVVTIGARNAMAGTRGIEEFLEFIDLIAVSTKDGLCFKITELTVQDDRAAVEFVGHAELIGGSAYEDIHFQIFYFRDGRIRRVKKYYDADLVEAIAGPLLVSRISSG